jgi:hypothetical protein
MTVMGVFTNFKEEFAKKIIENHTNILWIITPLVTIFGYDITPLHCIFVGLILLLLYRISMVIKDIFDMIKTISGHILMVSLWLWFTVIGNQEKAIMYITSPETVRIGILWISYISYHFSNWIFLFQINGP